MNQPMPFVIGCSTPYLMQDFDTDVYDTSSSSLIYKIVAALCGPAGAGQLLSQNFLNILQGSLDTTYGSDLDYVFGNIGFLPRTPAEMYLANAAQDLLTSYQWDEVRKKDSWYRARIRMFWKACSMGGTPDAIRLITQAACSCDANIFEVWRYLDNFGITDSLGRSNSRNEVVVQPLKSELTPQEFKVLRDMLDRVMPLDTVVTINTQGLAVHDPVPVSAACANSTYYEVQKMVTATPLMSKLPPPQFLPMDLLPTETWLYEAQTTPTLAPYAQLNISAQTSFYYLFGVTASPINAVTYGTVDTTSADPMSTFALAPTFYAYSNATQYGPFTPWPKADSPDNYPGGKFGLHPAIAPALNTNGTPYAFPWPSQADYITAQTTITEKQGGIANANGYQLPIIAPTDDQNTANPTQATTSTIQIAFLPQYAVATSPPGRESTITASLTRHRPVQDSGTQGWTSTTGFVRS